MRVCTYGREVLLRCGMGADAPGPAADALWGLAGAPCHRTQPCNGGDGCFGETHVKTAGFLASPVLCDAPLKVQSLVVGFERPLSLPKKKKGT